jgi:triacylglycerol esterase/lipase EstA (alpha/beta hydrolase family)
MGNTHPVILVHGLLGFGPKELGPMNYWGSGMRVASPLERHEASVGPLSSAHDRACELAAQIKGTQVDYGASHAESAGHARYGPDYSGRGFVPAWSATHPVHLVGHSLGSPTCRCLQHLLATDFWGWGSDERWVRSISTISGVSNGSTLVYFFGVDEWSGRMRPESGMTPLLRMLEVFTSASGAILDAVYNFDLDHWGYLRGPDESLMAYLRRVSRSQFLWGMDNAAYSLSLQGAYRDNRVWRTYPDSYYFAYVTVQSKAGWFSGRHYPSMLMNPAMVGLSGYIGQKVFHEEPIPGFRAEDWWENDGAVSTYSQIYPHISGEHPVGETFEAAMPPEAFLPGRWYTKWERGMDHLDICVSPQPLQVGRQKDFYQDLYGRLAALPGA